MKSFARLLPVLAMLAAAAERQGHRLTPDVIPPTAARVGALQAPAGFRIDQFATGLGKPRMLAIASDGAVYVTRRDPGDCVMLVDDNRDGRADRRTVVARRPGLHGIALHGNHAYFATVRDVFRATRQEDGSFGSLEKISGGLPEGGRHPNRTLAVGPGGLLYLSVGSTCNVCREDQEESATILRLSRDGGKREIFASGLRNTIGFDWDPRTRQLWGLDHGTDWLGDTEPPEELNQLMEGGRYGWPYVYGNGKPVALAPPPPGQISKEEWGAKSRPPALTYTPHAAPMQMAFYRGTQFPAEYRQDAFAAMHGSWNRKPPSGYEVVRIHFQEGKPRSVEPFISGFLAQNGGDWTTFGRPAGLAIAPDGSLLFSDDENGVIYRVWWAGK